MLRKIKKLIKEANSLIIEKMLDKKKNSKLLQFN